MAAPPEAASSPRSVRLTPVDADERIHALDVLRGWAMFGVLWSNLNDNYGTLEPVSALDHSLEWIQYSLVEGRFYSLLVLLFGIGFGIQLTRADALGKDLRGTYYRRTALLLVIGIVHGTLVWNGDILTIYALVAFALVMFRTASTRQVLIAAVLLWFAGETIVRDAMYLSGLRIRMPDVSGESVALYARGTWLQIQHARVGGYLRWLGYWGLIFYPGILASFLMGLWAVKSGYLRRVTSEPRVTRRLLAVALGAAAVGYAALQWQDALWPRFQAPAGFVGAFPYPYYQLNQLRVAVLRLFDWSQLGSSLAYAAVLLLLWQRPLGARALRPLAATGRMALTTYLTQSVVCTLLFYSYGLGWYGSVGFTGMLAITLILFGCQMAASTWWLKRFRFGPVEYLWRVLTYGRIAPVSRRGEGPQTRYVPPAQARR